MRHGKKIPAPVAHLEGTLEGTLVASENNYTTLRSNTHFKEFLIDHIKTYLSITNIGLSAPKTEPSNLPCLRREYSKIFAIRGHLGRGQKHKSHWPGNYGRCRCCWGYYRNTYVTHTQYAHICHACTVRRCIMHTQYTEGKLGSQQPILLVVRRQCDCGSVSDIVLCSLANCAQLGPLREFPCTKHATRHNAGRAFLSWDQLKAAWLLRVFCPSNQRW